MDESLGKRTPFSARLPQIPLGQALPIAETLAKLAAPASPAVIAQHMGTTRSSSGFKSKLAAAGYYGLVEVDGDRRTLTDRGTAITGTSADGVAAAKREAVMSTSFGPIVHSLRGHAVNEAIVSSRLHGDYNVPVASADKVAVVLIKSATEAGLVTDGRFDAVAIEAHADVLARITPPQTPTPASAPKPADTKPKQARKQESAVVETAMEPRPFTQGVQVVVKIDATGLTPQQIAELVQALQARATPA